MNNMHNRNQTIMLAACLVLISLSTTTKAFAHYDPSEDRDQATNTINRWNTWNNDSDRRWRRNWAPNYGYAYPTNYWYSNCAPWDTDAPLRRPCVNQSCQSQSATTKDSSPQISDQIPNFHQVDSFLYRGGQPTQNAFASLSQMGIRTIVNLCADPRPVELERQLCEQNGLRFINIPLVQTAAPCDQDICRFMDVVDGAKKNPNQGPVFVHDHLGADRVGCIVGIYRELADKYPFNRAYNEMLQYGFHDSYTNLKQAVQKLDPIATASATGAR